MKRFHLSLWQQKENLSLLRWRIPSEEPFSMANDLRAGQSEGAEKEEATLFRYWALSLQVLVVFFQVF